MHVGRILRAPLVGHDPANPTKQVGLADAACAFEIDHTREPGDTWDLATTSKPESVQWRIDSCLAAGRFKVSK